MKIALVGAVESSQRALSALIDAGCAPTIVVTLAADLAKRHSDFVDLAPLAQAHGVAVARVRNINDPDAIEVIRTAAPDFIFVVGWSQICGAQFMELAPGRVIGYHPAPLPRMRGRATLPWTILNNEKITGATLFWMDDGVDTGDILEQRFFHVAPRETARTLYDKHLDAVDALIRNGLSALASASPPRVKQDETCATYAARRRPEDGRIDWSLSAGAIERLIRAVGRPYPGAFTTDGSEQITIWQARYYTEHEHHGLIGQVVEVSDEAIDVITGDGMLRIEEWETSGHTPIRKHIVLGKD